MLSRLQPSLLVALLVVPWLWPFTPGPSSSVAPLLAGWACLLAAIPLIALQSSPRDALADAVPASWRIAAFVSAAIGLAQWFGVAPHVSLVSSAQLGEAYGNLRQKNQFATLLALGFAAFVWQQPARRWPGYAAVVLLAAANAASASRTGGLEWVMITALAAVWPGERRRRLQLCACGLAAYVVAGMLLPHALEALQGVTARNVFGRTVAELGCSSRRVLWANVLHLIGERPWTGWGAGELDFAHYDTLYSGARFCDILDNAHNLPLHLAVEFGIPVAVAVVSAIGWALWRGRPWRATEPGEQVAWAALAVIALHSMLEYPLWYSPFQIAVVLSVWLLCRPAPMQHASRAIAGAGAAMGLGLIAWAFVLYGNVAEAYKMPEDRRPAYQADPIGAAGDPLVFRPQLRFAELSIASVSRATAPRVLELAREMLHYSPEPMVAEKLIESAMLLGYTDEALRHCERFRAAFPERYAEWTKESATGRQLAVRVPPPGQGEQ